jgi:serine/threonine-protein kinase
VLAPPPRPKGTAAPTPAQPPTPSVSGPPVPPAGSAQPKPTTAEQFHTQARKLNQDEHFAEAIPQFTEAIKLNPSHALAYNGRGWAHFRLKQYTEAAADFDEAIKLNPSYANAYMNRAAARRALGDKAGADADQAKFKELSAAK